MKLLILAAGEGSRISSFSKIKPLTRLFGLTLLERVIKTAEKAGISDIYVVVGAYSKEIRDFIEEKKLQVKVIENKNWKNGNGSSVYAAKEVLADCDEFLITMADHVSDGKALKALIDHPMVDCDLLLAVDPNPKKYINMEDATKILFDEESLFIKQAGKELTVYNGVDTGFFKCKTAIFEALEKTKEIGSLTAGINWLAQKNRAKAVPVSEFFWIDIDTKEDFLNAKKIMLSSLSKATDGPIAKHINRKFSIPISSFISNFNITPNQISFFSFLLCFLASMFFLTGNNLGFKVGGLITQIASIIDGCDGEIARLKHLDSKFGAWFDSVLDRLSDSLLILGSFIGLFKTGLKPMDSLLLLWFALTGSFLLSYTASKYDEYIKRDLIKGFRIGRDLRLFIIFLGAILNLLHVSLIIVGAIAFIETIRRVWLVHKLEKS